jgi:signal peptidase I
MNDPSLFYSNPKNPGPLGTPNGIRPNIIIQEPLRHPFWEVVKFTIIALLIVIPIRLFIIQPFIVSGESMTPAFQNNDYLIVDQISYEFASPQRGDVIIFKYPLDTSRFFIKRVIGMPGDRLVLDLDSITAYNEMHPDGLLLDEPYVDLVFSPPIDITLAEDEYFVMGDNRGASSDSRSWGPLKEEFVVGRALMRLFPPKTVGVLPGNHRNTFEEIPDEVFLLDDK